MAVALKPLAEQTIVITGASSGIGLATAVAAAARGARVVLAARNEDALHEVQRRITIDGGTALHVVADVAREDDLRRVAHAAIDRFGGFDTWVNNAGVDIWGRLEDVDDEDHRRLFETNFWGTVHGSLVAVEHLKRRGGALINLGSAASDRAYPLQGMYCASKHAIKGFTDTLRMELEEQGAPVSVTLIKPAAIGTPLPQHAKNYFDREPQLPPPLYAPEEVAAAILHAASHPRRDVFVGGSAKVFSAIGARMPRLMDLFGEKAMIPMQLRAEPARMRPDNLYGPGTDGYVRGEQRGRLHPSIYTRAALHRGVTSAVAGVAAGVLAAQLLRRRGRG